MHPLINQHSFRFFCSCFVLCENNPAASCVKWSFYTIMQNVLFPEVTNPRNRHMNGLADKLIYLLVLCYYPLYHWFCIALYFQVLWFHMVFCCHLFSLRQQKYKPVYSKFLCVGTKRINTITTLQSLLAVISVSF